MSIIFATFAPLFGYNLQKKRLFSCVCQKISLLLQPQKTTCTFLRNRNRVQRYYKKSKYANKNAFILLFAGFCESSFGGMPEASGVRSTTKN